MAVVEQYLVHRDDGLVLLFTPPFDPANLDPGYINSVARGISSVELDDAPLAGGNAHIPLAGDSRTHQVRIILGAETPGAPRRA
jgi:hypothetical protein